MPPKEPPCVVTLRKIAAYMGWTVKAVLWRAEHELFPLKQTFYGHKSRYGFKYILYLDDLERWQTAKRKAAIRHIQSKRGYHASNYPASVKALIVSKRSVS